MSDKRPDTMPDDEVAEDDAIIGRAFRGSMLAFAVGVAVVLATVWLMREETVPEAVTEAPQEAARAAPADRAAAAPEVEFRDVAATAGVDFVHENGAFGERFLPETMGGGVAFLDYDSDGDQDLAFVNGRGWPWHDDKAPAGIRLYRNDGTGVFEETTSGSGLESPLYGMGVAVADVDADGQVDIFVTALGRNRLFRNLGGGRFADVTSAAGVGGDAESWSTGAAFLDYDRDGDLDLFVTNYVRWSREIDLAVDYRLAGIGRAYGPPTNYAGTFSWLYRNEGDAVFTEIGESAGIRVVNPASGLPAGKGLGVAVTDIDGDFWPDLVVANDTVANFVFHNLGDGRFEESGAALGVAFDSAGNATGAMGIDVAQLERDGGLAIAIGNFANEMTSFYVAPAGLPVFTDEAIVSGIGPDSRRALSFGLFFFDYDLDGREDLFQCNGHVENEINLVQSSQHYRQPAQLFWNCGPDCPRPFVQVPGDSLGDLARPIAGRGAAYGDMDADGDLDLVVTQVAGPPLVLRNEQKLGHRWLGVHLEGADGNRDALGARVQVQAGSELQTRSIQGGGSYLSQSARTLVFGLGHYAGPLRVIVRWPDGTEKIIQDPAVNTVHRIRQLAVGAPGEAGNRRAPAGS